MRDFVEGDRVWYQPLNGNSWLGPASVLCQRGQSVWIHTNGDIKKVAACKTKPYELLEMDSQNTLNPPDSQFPVPDSQSPVPVPGLDAKFQSQIPSPKSQSQVPSPEVKRKRW